jgi:hypothetical protein
VSKEEKKKEKKRAEPKIAPMGEMIIVNVNDRLGTKASIPCLASDPISMFITLCLLRLGRGLIFVCCRIVQSASCCAYWSAAA